MRLEHVRTSGHDTVDKLKKFAAAITDYGKKCYPDLNHAEE